MSSSETVILETSGDIVAARRVCREMARCLGFGSADQTRLATAVSEIARNAVQYAGEGVCIVRDESDDEAVVISVVVEDNGPGIDDIDTALQPGFSTGDGLGAGLPGARRLVHRFAVESRPGHTAVTMKMVRKKV